VALKESEIERTLTASGGGGVLSPVHRKPEKLNRAAAGLTKIEAVDLNQTGKSKATERLDIKSQEGEDTMHIQASEGRFV